MASGWWGLITIITFHNGIIAQVLTPPYFNLAVTRNIEATSTCGFDEKGQKSEEMYCKLTGGAGLAIQDLYYVDYAGSDSYLGYDATQRQLCEYCTPDDPELDHRVEFAVDGTERWWQSPPLSRGLEYNKVNITINLRQVSNVDLFVFLCLNKITASCI